MTTQDLAYLIELHDVEGLWQAFSHGFDPNAIHNDQPLIYELIGEYTRGPRFKECVHAFIEHGLRFENQALLAVLANDATKLKDALSRNPENALARVDLRCAYTPMDQVTLLHVCAEFNHLDCARELVSAGAEVNAHAGADQLGFGRHTPIFHTVNQNGNHSYEMLLFLLEHQADLEVTVPGLVWGRGYDWETFIPSVNPISYAMMGLLPQMHRSEETTSEIVAMLIKHRYGIDYQPANVPCKYLHK